MINRAFAHPRTNAVTIRESRCGESGSGQPRVEIHWCEPVHPHFSQNQAILQRKRPQAWGQDCLRLRSATLIAANKCGFLWIEYSILKSSLVLGAFDLFHVGHIMALKAARELGNYLIVGIHGDDEVMKVRGSGNPLCNIHERTLGVLQCKVHMASVT